MEIARNTVSSRYFFYSHKSIIRNTTMSLSLELIESCNTASAAFM
jgi:hypothetical protein